MEVQDNKTPIFQKGDPIKPSKWSPFKGGSYEDNDFEVVEVIDTEMIVVLRNGFHRFRSMNCYFDKALTPSKTD